MPKLRFQKSGNLSQFARRWAFWEISIIECSRRKLKKAFPHSKALLCPLSQGFENCPRICCVFCPQAWALTTDFQSQLRIQYHQRCLLYKWPKLLTSYCNSSCSNGHPGIRLLPKLLPPLNQGFLSWLPKIPIFSVMELSHSAGQHSLPMLSDGYKWPVGYLSLVDLALRSLREFCGKVVEGAERLIKPSLTLI